LAKKKQQQPKREPTRRQLSRWEQEKKRQRIIFISGIVIIAAVLITIGSGWYVTRYQPLHQTVISVNDASFDMSYYINMLKRYSAGQSTYYLDFLADQVVTVIQRDALIRQGALQLGISVSDEEVDEELQSRDPPLSNDYREIIRTDMLITKLENEYFENQVPLSAPQRHVLVMFLENENQAQDIIARIEAGEDFGKLAGELSLDAISQTKNGDLDWHPQEVLTELLESSVPADYAFNAETGTISQPLYDQDKTKGLGYWLIKVVETNQDTNQSHIQAILLGSEAEAQYVKARLESGEDFATLAKQLSQYPGAADNSGDLGWLTPGTMGTAFDMFAFNTETQLDKVSDPILDETVETSGGYWLVKVLDEDDNKTIADDDRVLLKSKALNEWVDAMFKDPANTIKSYLDEDKKLFAIMKVIGELGQ